MTATVSSPPLRNGVYSTKKKPSKLDKRQTERSDSPPSIRNGVISIEKDTYNYDTHQATMRTDSPPPIGNDDISTNKNSSNLDEEHAVTRTDSSPSMRNGVDSTKKDTYNPDGHHATPRTDSPPPNKNGAIALKKHAHSLIWNRNSPPSGITATSDTKDTETHSPRFSPYDEELSMAHFDDLSTQSIPEKFDVEAHLAPLDIAAEKHTVNNVEEDCAPNPDVARSSLEKAARVLQRRCRFLQPSQAVHLMAPVFNAVTNSTAVRLANEAFTQPIRSSSLLRTLFFIGILPTLCLLFLPSLMFLTLSFICFLPVLSVFALICSFRYISTSLNFTTIGEATEHGTALHEEQYSDNKELQLAFTNATTSALLSESLSSTISSTRGSPTRVSRERSFSETLPNAQDPTSETLRVHRRSAFLLRYLKSVVSSTVNTLQSFRADPMTVFMTLLFTPLLCLLAIPFFVTTLFITLLLIPFFIALPVLLLSALPILVLVAIIASIPFLMCVPQSRFRDVFDACKTRIRQSFSAIRNRFCSLSALT